MTKQLSGQANNIYVLYCIGAVAAFIPNLYLFIFGLVAVTVGFAMMYNFRGKASDDPVLSDHARWMVRTFWIANLVLFPIAAIINVSLVHHFTEYSELVTDLSSGNFSSIEGMMGEMYRFEQDNHATLLKIKISTYGIVIAWWLWRYTKGFKLLKAGQSPYKNTEHIDS